MSENNIVILNGARTAMGSFQGSLAPMSAPQLGGACIREAVARAGLQAADVEDVVMGCVLPAGLKQGPARQAMRLAGLKKTVSGYDQSIKDTQSQIGELKTQIDSAVKAVNESSSQWRTQINQLETQVDVVVDTVKQLEQQNQSQKDAIAELRNSAGGADQLKQRLDDIDAAIKAFDQYRIQVNNRLDRLEQ